ncbi:heterokaryon incompatibility protein-domain-containing protein [Immersiella caudata]|uniref:Heterokaryon incompatibility protein-domain-containing protein n=1 Tax=Immersiella caudata TaxID=314043 RepID=A0AA40BWR6_9PEZI|nr:heterokaryon incompatibility protein-domain-containing protein [Immersiella caudata]
MRSEEMLCGKCRSLRFLPTSWNQRESSRNLSFTTHICVLHESRESFFASIAEACHLCCLIQAQLGTREYASPECDVLGAFVALLAEDASGFMASKWRPSLHISIASRLGNGSLGEVPEEVTDEYAEALRANLEAGRQSWQGGRTGRGASLPENVSSPGLKLARLWRDNCLANHQLCNLASPLESSAPSPTRLLNVANPNRPFLEETSAWQPYVALSYCWGLGEKFVTLRANAEDHRKGIAIEMLPKTFKHAIYATHQLGYSHVWIDALCIIQDDKADLGKELGHMGDIYRHAALTLRAASAISSHAGFFHNRNPLQLHPCRVRVTWDTSPDIGAVLNIHLTGTCSGHNYLTNRGWILQEDVLAPRAITFGSQVSWRCMETTADETRPIPVPCEVAESGAHNMRRWLYASQHAMEKRGALEKEKFGDWQEMVCEYSDRELSVKTDTLRALSGLADMFSQVHGTTYLAGLWRENAVSDLCWYVSANDKRPVQRFHNMLAAPSWSWASVGKVRIRFPTPNWELNKPKLDRRPAPAVLRHGFCASRDPINAASETEFQNLSVRDRWLLKLAGPVRRLTMSLRKEYSEWRINNAVYRDSRAGMPDVVSASAISSRIDPRFPALLHLPDSSRRMVGEVALDYPILPAIPGRAVSDRRDDEMEVFCLPLFEDFLDGLPSPHILCLILAPFELGSPLYRRLGIGYLTEEGWFGGEAGDGESLVECEIV